MPLIYPKKTVVLNSILEALSFLFLWPKLLFLHFSLRGSNRLKVKHILLIEPFGMGDILSLSIMIDPLLDVFSNAKILLLTKTGNEDVFADDSRVSRVYTAPFPWSKLSGEKHGSVREWVAVIKICRKIASFNPDLGLDTRGDIRSQILMVLCGCRKRVGFANYLNTNINIKGFLLTTKVENPGVLHRYEMNRYLLENGLGLTRSSMNFPCFKPSLPLELLGFNGITVLFHVGARWKYRQWPVEKWIALGERLVEEGIEPCIVGSVAEEAILDRICSETSFTKVIADMRRLIQLIKGCDLLVCLDSGPMHLAQTLGIPVVALFGPGDFELWKPCGKKDRYVFHRLPCNPCLQLDCVHPANGCMQRISVDEVFCQIIGALENG